MRHRFQQLGSAASRHSRTLRGMMHVDRHDLAGTVLLAGSGRSGTTWLGQMINSSHAYREIFEPLHPGRVRQVRSFPTTRHIPIHDNNPHLRQTLRDLLAGRVRCAWTDQYNRRTFARQRLIKIIRGNLMLGYIRQQFPQIKLYFAMRHPCSVAVSRLKLGWAPHLHEMLAQPALIETHLQEQQSLIEKVHREGDAFEQHIVMWCIENRVPLRELNHEGVCVLQYERFCTAFNDEVVTLFNWLGQDVPQQIDAARQRVSAHYRRDSAVVRGAKLTGGWRKHVSGSQLDAVLRYLEAFDLSHLYDASDLPLVEPSRVFIDPDRRRLPQTQRGAA